MLGESLAYLLAEDFLASPGVDGFVHQSRKIVLQDGLRSRIDSTQAESPVEDQHPCRQIGQNRFQVGTRRFDLGTMLFSIATRLVQLARHLVKGLSQHTQFVTTVDRLARGKVPGRHGLCTFCQDGKRRGEASCQNKRHGDGRKQSQEHGQGQRHGIDASQSLATKRELLIIAVNVLHAFSVERQGSRHRLSELQDARLHTQTGGNDRNQDAQHEFLPASAFNFPIAAAGTGLTQLVGSRRRWQEGRNIAGRRRQQLSVRREHGDILHTTLLAQAVERCAALRLRLLAQLQGNRPALFTQVVKQ